MNRDESDKCYKISQELFKKGEYDRALRFAEKCHRMEPSKEHEEWLSKLRSESPSKNDAENKPNGSGNTGHPESGQKNTSHKTQSNDSKTSKPQENEKNGRPYTKEQIKKIKEICSHRERGDLYSILGLEKNCDSSEIKRAYRKLALQFHPDKCSAPGADEAFKAIGFSFSILSNETKRKAYDVNGIRSTSRSGASGSQPNRGSGHEEYDSMSFDDYSFDTAQFIFDSFFRGGFVGAPLSTHMFGYGPGIFVTRSSRLGGFGQNSFTSSTNSRSSAGARQNSRFIVMLMVMASLIISSLIKQFFSAKEPPYYGFAPTSYLNQKQTTNNHQIDYWVNNDEWSRWLKYLKVDQKIQISTTEDGYKRKHWNRKFPVPSSLYNFEHDVASDYLAYLNANCINESNRKKYLISRAKGWIHTDKNKLSTAQSIPLPSCDKLKKLRKKMKYNH